MSRIFITGAGAVTPVGVGVPAFREAIISKKCAIDELCGIDTEKLAIKRGAQVRDFDARSYLSMKLVQDLEPYARYAYVAAEEAIAQSGINTESCRLGVVMGSALSGINVIGETGAAWAVEEKSAGPKFLTKSMGNIAAAQLEINHKIQGPSFTVSTACSSGSDALTLAAMLIRAGAADAMIVMAGEAAICPSLIQSLTKCGALSKTGQSRPFDKNRNGFVLGEGGGAVVIESEGSVRARAAEPLAELLGCANNTDAFNPVSPDPLGRGAAKCMELALKDAGLSPDDIDYINAHGTATKAGDIAEASAIHMVFEDRPVAVSSTKGMTGHMMGAGGLVELIACINALNDGVLPVNVGFSEPDPDCALNIVTDDNCRKDIRTAMSNALGFGGQNSSIIVGRIK